MRFSARIPLYLMSDDRVHDFRSLRPEIFLI